jgi:hypothetical protein
MLIRHEKRRLPMTMKPRRALCVAALSLCAVCNASTLPAADTLSFYRLYTSADGNSHFSNEEILFSKLEGGPAALTASRIGDVKNAMFLKLKAGATEPYHVAPRRQLMICLRGIVEVTAGDGDKRRVLPGQFVLLEDTTGKGHITHAVGPEDHVALAFPMPDEVLTRK